MKKKKRLWTFSITLEGEKLILQYFQTCLEKSSWRNLEFLWCVCVVCVVCVLCVVFNLVVYVLQHYGKMERWKEVELKVKETNPIQQRETDPRLYSNIFSS